MVVTLVLIKVPKDPFICLSIVGDPTVLVIYP